MSSLNSDVPRECNLQPSCFVGQLSQEIDNDAKVDTVGNDAKDAKVGTDKLSFSDSIPFPVREMLKVIVPKCNEWREEELKKQKKIEFRDRYLKGIYNTNVLETILPWWKETVQTHWTSKEQTPTLKVTIKDLSYGSTLKYELSLECLKKQKCCHELKLEYENVTNILYDLNKSTGLDIVRDLFEKVFLELGFQVTFQNNIPMVNNVYCRIRDEFSVSVPTSFFNVV